jgi:uncharacterized membrane protein YhhN
MPPLWIAAAVVAVVYLGIVASGRKNVLKVAPALFLAAAALPAGWLAVLAFVACAAGDAFLLAKEKYFLHGLAAFLVGHVLLVAVFTKTAVTAPPLGVSLGMIAVAGAVLWQIFPRLTGILRIAVPIYALALGAMVVAAGAVSPLAMVGAVVFVVSDSVLALNRFLRPLPGAEIAVMSTYYAAILTISAALY